MDRFLKPAGALPLLDNLNQVYSKAARDLSSWTRQKIESNPEKRVREHEPDVPSKVPATANRLKFNKSEVSSFIKTKNPDVLFISEVRMPARGPSNCKRDDGQPRTRGQFSDDKKDREDSDLITSWARESGYKMFLSLSDWRYSGVALLVKLACEQPTGLRYSLDHKKAAAVHHPEGRVISCEFKSFEFLGVYVPNCGRSFDRRRAWDHEMKQFVSIPRAKPLLLCGDLNVAPEWHDVSHPKWFRENNCLEAPDPGDRGQPGFTPNEQSRFAEITAAGGLVDAYRALHASAEWQDCVTWRGAAGKDVAESGRYYNKGMRIDLFMLQESLKDRIEEVEVCGRGPNMEGFLGSDHSPLLLHLRAADPVPAPAIAAAASSACVAAETAEPEK